MTSNRISGITVLFFCWCSVLLRDKASHSYPWENYTLTSVSPMHHLSESSLWFHLKHPIVYFIIDKKNLKISSKIYFQESFSFLFHFTIEIFIGTQWVISSGYWMEQALIRSPGLIKVRNLTTNLLIESWIAQHFSISPTIKQPRLASTVKFKSNFLKREGFAPFWNYKSLCLLHFMGHMATWLPPKTTLT